MSATTSSGVEFEFVPIMQTLGKRERLDHELDDFGQSAHIRYLLPSLLLLKQATNSPSCPLHRHSIAAASRVLRTTSSLTLTDTLAVINETKGTPTFLLESGLAGV